MDSPAEYDVPEYLVRHTVRLCQNLTRVDSLLDLHDFTSEIIKQHRERAAADPSIRTDRLPDPEKCCVLRPSCFMPV